MDNENIRKSGVRIGRDESAFEAIQKAMPHWIHKTKEDPDSLTGFLYLPACTCSACGFEVRMEKERCPHCGAKMVR